MIFDVMKRHIYFILLLIPIVGVCQEIPKKADRIIVANDKTASENFILVKQILADKGIEIANQDKDINQIKSGSISITKYGANGYFIFNCKDKNVLVTGMFKAGYEVSIGGVKGTDDFESIAFKGMNGSLYKASFEKMNDFAKLLGKDIKYEVSN